MKLAMPAEWELHEATWLVWPHNRETWPGKGKFEKIPPVWVKFVKALSPYEKVKILVNDAEMEKKAKTMLVSDNALNENVFFYHIPTNDAWIRDFGPIFVRKNGAMAMTDWIFNVWGQRWGKKRPLDDAVPKNIAEQCGYECMNIDMVLEGGSIDVNGKGTLMTTESCLLSKTRNPHLSRTEIERFLKKYLGVHHFIWLKSGIIGDDTSGHIDDIARFVNPTTIVCIPEQENLKILRLARDQDGNPLTILELPMPKSIPGPKEEGYTDECIPASYANFYIANHVVLLPVFGQKTDQEAIEILQHCFPSRKIIPINSVDLVWGLGGIHCVTQQQPRNL